MSIKQKVVEEREASEESETKDKVFLQEKLGPETEEIIIENAHMIGKKVGKSSTIISNFLNYKQLEKVLSRYRELKL